jgi:hypothetical protein
MWKTVQSKGGIAKPVQLIIDMKVRWSSTYLMLHRAEANKMVSTVTSPSLSFILILLQFVDTFIDELRWEETEPAKCDKIRELKLNNEEWKNVDMFVGLLAVCISHTLVIQIYESILSACRQCTTSIFI